MEKKNDKEVKLDWLCQSVNTQLNFCTLVDKKCFQESPDIRRRVCLQRGQGVFVRLISVYGSVYRQRMSGRLGNERGKENIYSEKPQK